jgi:hypothetical protein
LTPVGLVFHSNRTSPSFEAHALYTDFAISASRLRAFRRLLLDDPVVDTKAEVRFACLIEAGDLGCEGVGFACFFFSFLPSCWSLGKASAETAFAAGPTIPPIAAAGGKIVDKALPIGEAHFAMS